MAFSVLTRSFSIRPVSRSLSIAVPRFASSILPRALNRSLLSYPSFPSSLTSRCFSISSSPSTSSSSSPPSTGPPQSIVVTLAGPDRRGIVHSLAKRLSEMNANIEESRMTILGNDFAVILLVQLPSSSVTPQHVRDALQQLFPDFLVNTRPTLNHRPFLPSPHRILTLNVHGPDQPGIVRNLTELFVSYNISVRDLDTDSSSAPFAGYKIFNLKAVLAIPTTVNMDKFNEGLRQFEDKYGFEVEIDDPNHPNNNNNEEEEMDEDMEEQLEKKFENVKQEKRKLK